MIAHSPRHSAAQFSIQLAAQHGNAQLQRATAQQYSSGAQQQRQGASVTATTPSAQHGAAQHCRARSPRALLVVSTRTAVTPCTGYLATLLLHTRHTQRNFSCLSYNPNVVSFQPLPYCRPIVSHYLICVHQGEAYHVCDESSALSAQGDGEPQKHNGIFIPSSPFLSLPFQSERVFANASQRHVAAPAPKGEDFSIRANERDRRKTR